MTIIADFARAARCPTPLFTATAPLYAAAVKTRKAQDTAAVCAVLEEMADAHRRSRRRATRV